MATSYERMTYDTRFLDLRENTVRRREGLERACLLAVFLAGIFGATFLQKIAMPHTGFLPILVPIVFAGLAVGLVVLKPVFDPVRIGLYFVTIALAWLSAILFSPTYSAPSLLLLVVLYLPMAIAFEVTEDDYRRCMNAFVTVMLGFCAVLAAEHVVQFLISASAWPNFDKVGPGGWLIPGYNYWQPIVWGEPYHKPNAFVFLEVSTLSQYIALALAVEIAIFQRASRIAVLGGALMLTFAGTGVLLMALTLPVLLGRLSMRRMIMVIGGLLIVSLIAFKVGWFDIVSARMDEYKHNGSSANMRFIEPFDRLLKFLTGPDALIGGVGAGQIEKGRNFLWWPFTKATIEYGLIPAVVFYTYFLYALFRNAPYRSIAFTLAVWFTFEGSLLLAIYPLTCVLLVSMFVIRGAPAPPPIAGGLVGNRFSRRAPLAREHAPVPEAKPAVLPPARITPSLAAIDEPSTPIAAVLPETDGRVIYAVGDVHGRADLLERLIARIRTDARANPPQDDRRPMILFLGDYVDRGRASREVIEQVIALQQDPDFDVRALLGNHEEAMLAYLDGTSSGVNFGRYGGRETLLSYGVEPPAPQAGREEWEAVRPGFKAAVPAIHETFLRNLEVMITIGQCVFVHAGVRPGVALDQQSRRDLLFIRDEFFAAPVDCGKFIVHGHTPGDGAVAGPSRLCLDTGAYASGILTAARLDGTEPRIIDVGRK